MRLAVSLLFAAVWTHVAPIHAQRADTTVRVAVGFGVDTGSIPNQEIFALWRTYLSSRPGCLQPAPLWSPSEQARWPVVDLLCSYVYQGFTRFTVVDLAPAIGLDSTYLIRTLVGRVSDPGQDLQPLALYRVYATREGGRWVLANALPRVTRRWNHETIGRVTFVYPRHAVSYAPALRRPPCSSTLSPARFRCLHRPPSATTSQTTSSKPWVRPVSSSSRSAVTRSEGGATRRIIWSSSAPPPTARGAPPTSRPAPRCPLFPPP